MNEVEIGLTKRAVRAYSFDDVAVVPSRRTRDPEDVSLAWSIDAFNFSMPVIAAPMDSVMSPATAVTLGKLGGLGVLNLEGLWTRYDDPTPVYEEIASLTDEEATRVLQRIYSEPIKAELIEARLQEIRDSGVPVAGSLSPQHTQEFSETVVKAGVDLFVIRGTTVSAEHVSQNREPLNLKDFIYQLDVPVIVGGAATYTAALHLMRTGAAGVLVGFGGGAASSTRAALGIHAPMATAISDVASARRDYLDESGGRYVHVIADGGLGRSGDIVAAIATGADAVMLGSTLAQKRGSTGQGLALGAGSAPSHDASGIPSLGWPRRSDGRSTAWSRPHGRCADQPHWSSASFDGHLWIFGLERIPARRRRGAGLTPQLFPSARL